MKTFQQFTEATEADVKAMGGSDAQIAALKKRQEKRGYGFQSNDQRNTSAPKKTQTARPTTPTVTRPTQPTNTTNKGSVKTATPGTGMPSSRSTSAPKPQPTNSSALVRNPKKVEAEKARAAGKSYESRPTSKPSSRGGDLATTPKPKSGSLTRHKMQVDKDKQASKSQARQRLNSGSGGRPNTSSRTAPKPTRKSVKPKQTKKEPNKYLKYAGKTASAVGSAISRPEPEAVTTGSETGNISGGSEYVSRTKRG